MTSKKLNQTQIKDIKDAGQDYLKAIGSLNVNYPPVLRAMAEFREWLLYQRKKYEIIGYKSCVEICNEELKKLIK